MKTTAEAAESCGEEPLSSPRKLRPAADPSLGRGLRKSACSAGRRSFAATISAQLQLTRRSDLRTWPTLEEVFILWGESQLHSVAFHACCRCPGAFYPASLFVASPSQGPQLLLVHAPFSTVRWTRPLVSSEAVARSQDIHGIPSLLSRLHDGSAFLEEPRMPSHQSELSALGVFFTYTLLLFCVYPSCDCMFERFHWFSGSETFLPSLTLRSPAGEKSESPLASLLRSYPFRMQPISGLVFCHALAYFLQEL